MRDRRVRLFQRAAGRVCRVLAASLSTWTARTRPLQDKTASATRCQRNLVRTAAPRSAAAAGSARPGRPLRLAFGERHGWITPLAALPLVPAFAILVCVPLALRAVGPGDSTGRLLIATYPIAAAAAILAIVLPSGIPAAAIALIWLAFTVLAALHGLMRALASGRRIEELSVAPGLMYF